MKDWMKQVEKSGLKSLKPGVRLLGKGSASEGKIKMPKNRGLRPAGGNFSNVLPRKKK